MTLKDAVMTSFFVAKNVLLYDDIHLFKRIIYSFLIILFSLPIFIILEYTLSKKIREYVSNEIIYRILGEEYFG